MKLLDRFANRRPRDVAGLPGWASTLFTSPVTPRLTDAEGGVRVWSVDDPHSTATISKQFTTEAAEYDRRYSARSHFENLFRKGLEGSGVKVASQPLVLDIGSGSGTNSVVPALSLFPGARFIATDLSGELLAMLADYAVHEGLSDRIVCAVMDAMGDHVQAGQFDLVTGAAILHHLQEPERGIAAAGRALKPGGHAIFFEPFNGWGVLRMAYERILAEAEWRGGLDERVASGLKALVFDLSTRTTANPEIMPHLDDKWLFSRVDIERWAKDAGFSRAQFIAHADHATLYRDLTTITLRLGSGHDDMPLPDWGYAILADFDAAMPQAAKRDLMVEGTIVLTK